MISVFFSGCGIDRSIIGLRAVSLGCQAGKRSDMTVIEKNLEASQSTRKSSTTPALAEVGVERNQLTRLNNELDNW
jgi:hypothetical protein